MNGRYILDAKGDPVAEHDLIAWGDWMQTFQGRVVAKTTVGDVFVSTVFLGLDHNWERDHPPELFETMVFGGVLDEEQDRYATRAQALEGHTAMVKRVTAEEVPTAMSDEPAVCRCPEDLEAAQDRVAELVRDNAALREQLEKTAVVLREGEVALSVKEPIGYVAVYGGTLKLDRPSANCTMGDLSVRRGKDPDGLIEKIRRA